MPTVKVHQCQNAPSIVFRDKVDFTGIDQEGHHWWKQIIKKRDRISPHCTVTSQKTSGRMSFWQMRKNMSFLARHIHFMFTCSKMKCKNTVPTMREWRVSYVLGLFCVAASGTGCLEFVQHTIKYQNYQGTQWQVVCLPIRCWHKNTRKWLRAKYWTILKWPYMNPGLNPIQTWENWYSLLLRSGPKYLVTAAGGSLTVTEFV